MIYLLKTKGTAKIPDYIQIRDESFQLIAHCKVSVAIRTLAKHGISVKVENLEAFIEQLPIGKLTPIQEQS
ncbi:MAG: hypothetical protein JXR60_07005 [Bacteroidales bacterium]|nr:hypothetical protein [Bacteroidales bacterium]